MTHHWGTFTLKNREEKRYIHAGHDGNGNMYSSEDVEGDPDAFAFELHSCWDDVPYVKLQNKMHPEQWLHLGHDGNGLYCEPDDDHDLFKWELNNVKRKYFYLRNKAYPETFLYLDGECASAGCLGEDDPHNFQWKVVETSGKKFKGPDDDRTYSIENVMTGKCVYTGHDGDGNFYCNDDFGAGDEGPFLWLFDRAHGGLATFKVDWPCGEWKHMHVGHDGNGQCYLAPEADDSGAFEFFIIPAGDGAFMFRNKLHPDQYLGVCKDDPEHFTTAMESCDDVPEHMMWYMVRRDAEDCSDDTD